MAAAQRRDDHGQVTVSASTAAGDKTNTATVDSTTTDPNTAKTPV
jgi:hypothetical protein